VSNGDAPTAQDLLVAAGWVEQLLRPLVTAEWSVPAGELEWSVRQVVDHLVDVCGFYAIHLAAQSDRRLRVDVTPHPQAGNDERLDVLAATGRLLAVTISAADPTATGWHFMGSPTPRVSPDWPVTNCWFTVGTPPADWGSSSAVTTGYPPACCTASTPRWNTATRRGRRSWQPTDVVRAIRHRNAVPVNDRYSRSRTGPGRAPGGAEHVGDGRRPSPGPGGHPGPRSRSTRPYPRPANEGPVARYGGLGDGGNSDDPGPPDVQINDPLRRREYASTAG